jgi:hypothetical protein
MLKQHKNAKKIEEEKAKSMESAHIRAFGNYR